MILDDRQEVKSLKKALRALVFMNTHGESTVTEVALAIGVPRTTSYRLLETFAAEGYVEKQPHSDVYRLTSKVQRLSSGFGDTDLIVEIAKPLVRAKGEEIGWPVALATPRGQDMLVRISTDHDTSLAIDRYPIGFTTPMLYAPAGLCYLAFCNEEARQGVIERARASGEAAELLRKDGEYLAHALDQVRRRGYCHLLFAEYREGGLAVPLVVGGRAVGGLIMRYIKRSQKTAEIEGVYFPILRQLAADIASAYEAQVNRRMLEASSSTPASSVLSSVSGTPKISVPVPASLDQVVATRRLNA